MTQDILILLLPYLSTKDATELFQMCLSSDILGGKDNGVQKRGYKILAKLVHSGKVTVDAEPILGQLDKLVEGLAPAAKKVNLFTRMICISLIVTHRTGLFCWHFSFPFYLRARCMLFHH